MREVITFILSWLAITTVFVITLWLEGLELSFSQASNTLMLWGIVGLFAGGYFLVIGTPILYVLFKRKTVSRATFIFSGMLASIPMLIFSILSKEFEWVVASILAGIIGGLVFALRLPNQQST